MYAVVISRRRSNAFKSATCVAAQLAEEVAIPSASLSHLREIGSITRLQIQRSSLKVAHASQQVYDPAPLLAVEQVQITAQGVTALLPDGEQLFDVHHRAHPDSRFSGMNGVSIGFTSQYARMRDRFGDHMRDGVAGENILVDAADEFSVHDFKYGLVVQCSAGDAYFWLSDVMVAHPCVEFSRFALQSAEAAESSKAIKATLQFLDEGTRGFYATPVVRDAPPVVRLGDRIFISGS
jgi:hypothetical protein